jgi:hypothetical protein
MNSKNYQGKISVNLITELESDEVFVFGSNLSGQHFGGAAKVAHQKFGAQWGIGEGMTGQCYAFPTVYYNLERSLTLEEISNCVNVFLEVVCRDAKAFNRVVEIVNAPESELFSLVQLWAMIKAVNN